MKSIVCLQLPATSYACQLQQLHRSRDAAVLAHAPEVHRHQHGDAERQADAVQHVEPQQRAFADERAAEQREPRIVCGVNQLDVAEREQRRAGAFVARGTVSRAPCSSRR